MSNLGSNFDMELPVNLKDLFNLTFNFDNLIRTLNFFHNNNISFYSEFKNLEKRVLSLENLKNDIEDLKIKSQSIENMNENFNRSFTNMQERLMGIELRVAEAARKSDESYENVKINKIIVETHTKNISNMTKDIDDYMKKINLLKDDFEQNKIVSTNTETKLNDLSKDIKEYKENNNIILEQMKGEMQQTSTDLSTININLTSVNNNFMDFKNDIENKNLEYDSTLANIVKHFNAKQSLNEKFEKQSSSKKNNIIENIIDNGNNEKENANIKNILNEVEKNKKNYEKYLTSLKTEIEKCSKSNENTKKTVEKISTSFEEIKKNFDNFTNQFSTEKKKMYHLSNLSNLDLNNYATIDMIKKLSDSIKILNSTVTTKPNRDEMDSVIKKINSRLETVEMIQQGITSGPRTMINSSLVQDNLGEEMSNINNTHIFELLTQKKSDKQYKPNDIKNGILNFLKDEIKNLDFSKNEKFSDLVKSLHIQQEEITESLEKIKILQEKSELPSIMDELTKTRMEISKLFDENRENKTNISKILIDLKGGDENGNEESEEKNYDTFSGTINSKIGFLLNNYNKIYDKVVNMETKIYSMTKTMKDEVKLSLKNDTINVVNDFRNRLESFSNRFEDELKNKIDQIGLNTFENKLNSKLHYDLKDKLDKNELKKNNNVIKRKIDTLENKISKTLVDTIIDLQMDDAPLLLKKNSNNYELCASCNQPIPKNNYINTEYIPPCASNKCKNFRNYSYNKNYTSCNNSVNKPNNLKTKLLPNISSFQTK